MNKDFQADYERLNKTEASRGQMLEYSWALKALAEGLTERNVWGMFRHIDTAQRYLGEFRGHFVKTPELTVKDGELAAGLHTYMRKCMDSHLGTMLYQMIAENRGLPVWYAFVKGLVANKNKYREAIEEADKAYNLDQSTDNLLMLKALQMWEDEDFPDAIEWLKGT